MLFRRCYCYWGLRTWVKDLYPHIMAQVGGKEGCEGRGGGTKDVDLSPPILTQSSFRTSFIHLRLGHDIYQVKFNCPVCLHCYQMLQPCPIPHCSVLTVLSVTCGQFVCALVKQKMLWLKVGTGWGGYAPLLTIFPLWNPCCRSSSHTFTGLTISPATTPSSFHWHIPLLILSFRNSGQI